jgi:hypothetical protein
MDKKEENRMRKLVVVLSGVLFIALSPNLVFATNYSLDQPFGESDALYSMGGEYWFWPDQLDWGIIGLGTSGRGEWVFGISPESGPSGGTVYLDLTFNLRGNWSVYGTNLSSFTKPQELYSPVTLKADLFEYAGPTAATYNWTIAAQAWGDTFVDRTTTITLLLTTGNLYTLETHGDYGPIYASGYGALNPEEETRAELWTWADMKILDYSIRSVPEPITVFLLGPALIGLMAFRRKLRKD